MWTQFFWRKIMIHLPVNTYLLHHYYFYHVSVFTPNSFFPLHDHDFCEFFIVLQGRLRHIFNGKTTVCEPGTICFLHPEDMHELHCASGCSLVKIMNCNVLTDEARRLFRDIVGSGHMALEDCIQQISPQSQIRKQAIMEEAEEILNYPDRTLKKARLKLLLGNIFLLLIAASGFAADSAPEWLQSARTAMRKPENFRLGLKRFIELSGRTQEHLCRAMRRYYSETPQQWLTEVRLEAVFDRLLRQGGDISMMAFEAGFHNLSWFRRAFRQRYGVSPKTIRKKG